MSLDIAALDRAVANMETSNDARKYVEDFFGSDSAWLCVEPVLAGTTHPHTKFLALRALRDRIKTYWRGFDPGTQEHLHSTLYRAITDLVASGASPPVIAMADMALVEILKYEWPQRLSSFIPDLKEVAMTSSAARKNALQIVTYLADDIKSHRKDELCYDRYLQMNEGFARDFHVVMEIIASVLSSDSSFEEINECFVALRHFVPAMGDAFTERATIIFELCDKLIRDPKYSLSVFALYGEMISETPVQFPISNVFQTAMESLRAAFGDNPSDLTDDQVLALVEGFCPFFSKYLDAIGSEIDPQYIQTAVAWIEQLTAEHADSPAIFTACMEIWKSTSRQMYAKFKIGQRNCGLIVEPLIRLVPVIFSHIPQGYELVEGVEDDGTPCCMVERDGFASGWCSVCDTLVFMTHLIPDDFMANAVKNLISEVGESLEKVNGACRAFDAVCGALTKDKAELLFRDLTERLKVLAQAVVPNDVIIQPYLMMCSGQSRLFESEPRLLDDCVQTLFASMKSQNKETRAVAVFTLRNLARTCTKAFTARSESRPSTIDQILGNFAEICIGLEHQEIVAVIAAICEIVRRERAGRSERTAQLCSQIGSSWDQPSDPNDLESVQRILFLLKCYAPIANFLTTEFAQILGEKLLVQGQGGLQEIYRIYSQAAAGFDVHTREFVLYQKIRAEICNVLFNWLSKQTPADACDILEYFVDIAFEYRDSAPERRVPDVLKLFGAMLSKRKEVVPQFVDIWRALFDTTMPLLSSDYNSFYEFRQPLLVFLTAMILSPCFSVILGESGVFEQVLNALQWFALHDQPEISLKAINAYHLLLHQIILNHGALLPAFAPRLMLTLFDLLTDDVHKFAFTEIAKILKNLVRLETISQNLPSISEQLAARFPQIDCRELLMNMMNFKENILLFHDVMRDFLARAKQYSPLDPRFHKEEAAQAQRQEAEFRSQIPGLATPTTNPDQDVEDLNRLLGATNFF